MGVGRQSNAYKMARVRVQESLALVLTKTPIPSALELRRRRMERNLSQAQCAKIMKVCLSTWCKWESGKVFISEPLWELFLIKMDILKKFWEGQKGTLDHAKAKSRETEGDDW